MELKKAELEAREFVKRITDRREKMGKTLEIKKERGQYFAELLSSGFNNCNTSIKVTYSE